jgi:hypothetical protein
MFRMDTEIDWNKYAIGNSEIVPASMVLELPARVNRIRLEPLSVFLVTGLRYRIKQDCFCFFEINKREYGDWKLYGGCGGVTVYPRLLLTLESESFLCVRYFVPELIEISVDGNRIVRL